MFPSHRIHKTGIMIFTYIVHTKQRNNHTFTQIIPSFHGSVLSSDVFRRMRVPYGHQNTCRCPKPQLHGCPRWLQHTENPLICRCTFAILSYNQLCDVHYFIPHFGFHSRDKVETRTWSKFAFEGQLLTGLGNSWGHHFGFPWEGTTRQWGQKLGNICFVG